MVNTQKKRSNENRNKKYNDDDGNGGCVGVKNIFGIEDRKKRKNSVKERILEQEDDDGEMNGWLSLHAENV